MTENKIWTKEYFEKEFENPDPWKFFSSDYEQKKYERQIVFIKDRIPHPERILEIGCAEGAHTKMIAQEFPETEIVGVDVSSIAIHRAKENVKIDKVEFLKADIIECIDNIPDRYFDIIIWAESIYYIGDRLSVREVFEFFGKIVSKLKQRGILCTANIIDQPDAPETPSTKRPIMECYLYLLSCLAETIHRSTYLEYKKESDRYYEYQIWLFNKKL